MSDFEGLPAALFTFFADLENDNSKAFWEAHKATWENDVKAPMAALLADLEDEFPPLKMMRPNRDLRFTKDKSPYKLFIGAMSEPPSTGGTGYYLKADADGLSLACGNMDMTPEELGRFREAIDDDAKGAQFEDIVSTLASSSLEVSPGFAPALKRVPAPYAKDHPRADFLRWKGIVVKTEFEASEWMHTAELPDRIRDAWRQAEPLRKWLTTHVG